MLRKENYNGILIFGLALTLLVLVGFAAYLILEEARVEEAAKLLSDERLNHGREIFNEQCASCHGSNGEGGIGTALNNKALLQSTQDDIFFSVIRSGVPSTQMPAWSVDYGGALTDEDIRSTVSYIRSWEANAPVLEPAVFEPVPEQGALIFETNCAICHGENGEGTGFAPAVNDPANLEMSNDEWLREILNFGRPAKGMPSYGAILSEEQTGHLVALFKAWDSGVEVIPAYNVTSLINAAVFAMENDDIESAILYIDRALSIIVDSPAKDMISDAKRQLESGDIPGSLGTMTELQDQWPIGNPANGADLYTANCAVCHGANGEGGGDGVFPKLNPNEFIQMNTNAELVIFIQEGRQGTAMAGFDGRLNEQEIADIVAHLRTWQP